MSLAPGTRIGQYEVLASLGEGGMGEVYRARDARLGRDVAIKILPHAFTTDADRLARFEREARVLASLNHPNIATIYGIEESDGIRALVMELVDGVTLAERIDGKLKKTGLTVEQTLALARQIADALDAAHEKGIVHRDLKPANIKITRDSAVKVLDFGLAKADQASGSGLQASGAPTITIDDTREGVIVGTAAYMSPEQARGQSVDKRTDIWAYGCVLYEMLAGRAAFGGATVSDIIVTILEREPDWTALPAATPASVRQLLERCLDKDPRQRLRDIADARLHLDARPQHGRAVQTGTRLGLSPIWASAGLLLVAAAAGIGGWSIRNRDVPLENPLATARFTRLTDFEGIERDAAISPDGKFVAFISDRDGPFDVWLTQVGTGRFANLTQGKTQTLDHSYRAMGFAHDGSELWLHDGEATNPLSLLPLIGGAPRVFLDKSPGKTPPMNAAWSPDASRLLYHTSDAGDPMFIADRTGGNPRQIFIDPDPGIHNHWPVWSPDGRWIYFSRGSPQAEQFDLARISPDGGTPERVTFHNTLVTYPAPLGPRTVMYVARDQDGSGPWLWTLDPERKITRRVSFGLEQYTTLTASADGRRLAATVANPAASLWTVPMQDGIAEEQDVKPYLLPTVRALAPRFGGSSLFYLSSHGTGDGLWKYTATEAQEIWRGANGLLLWPPSVSPDGRRVAIALRKDGRRRLHVITADGAELQMIGESIEVQGTADWSPDGRWIVVGGIGAKGIGLFKVPVDGGQPVQLASGQSLNPVWSPDGQLIVYAGPQVAGDSPLLGVRPDGMRVPMPEIRVRRFGERARFLRNGSALVYMQGVSSSQNFWLLDLTSMQTRPLTRLTNPAEMRTFDIAPDGRSIVFDRTRANSDVVLIELAP